MMGLVKSMKKIKSKFRRIPALRKKTSPKKITKSLFDW